MNIEYTVLIPVKNESESLQHLIPKLITIMGGFQEPYEVLVVNDGSTDRTADVLRQFCKVYANLRVININPQLYAPVGLAIRLGLKNARGTYIISMDGDGSHDPGELGSFISQKRAGYKAIVGGRYFRHQTPFRPISRYLISKLFNKVQHFFLRKNIRDLTTGFRLFHKSIGMNLQNNDYELHSELNFKISRVTPRLVKEIPITYKKRIAGTSKLKYLKVFPRYLLCAINEFLHLNKKLKITSTPVKE